METENVLCADVLMRLQLGAADGASDDDKNQGISASLHVFGCPTCRSDPHVVAAEKASAVVLYPPARLAPMCAMTTRLAGTGPIMLVPDEEG